MGQDMTSLQQPPHQCAASTLSGQTLLPSMGLYSFRFLSPREVIAHVSPVKDGTPTATST